jgi:hypothetical protein
MKTSPIKELDESLHNLSIDSQEEFIIEVAEFIKKNKGLFKIDETEYFKQLNLIKRKYLCIEAL